MEKIDKYFSDCIFTMKGSNIKKTILRGFYRGHLFCLHAKFQVWYSTPSRFVKKMIYFCIIFAKKYFLAKYLRFYTSTKNFIKIRPKMSKRQPIKKKTFFYLLPLLTYSAMGTNAFCWSYKQSRSCNHRQKNLRYLGLTVSWSSNRIFDRPINGWEISDSVFGRTRCTRL